MTQRGTTDDTLLENIQMHRAKAAKVAYEGVDRKKSMLMTAAFISPALFIAAALLISKYFS